MYIQTGTIPFPHWKDTGPQNQEQVVNFKTKISSAIVGLAGFEAAYPQDDEELFSLTAQLQNKSISEHAVEVLGTFGLRDSSGRWNNVYVGHLRYVVLGVLPEKNSEEVRGGNLSFPPEADAGPRRQEEMISFGIPQEESEPFLNGFETRFVDEDHDFGELTVELSAAHPSDERLEVRGSYGLKDSSGYWDDMYEGRIGYGAVGVTDDDSLQVRSGSFTFPRTQGSGPQIQNEMIEFRRPIGNCAAMLSGFTIRYEEANQHIRRMMIDVEARKLSETSVNIVAKLGLRDNSDSWDNLYGGSVQYIVIGE